MKKNISNINNVNMAVWLLKIGLAAVFLYAGVSSLRQPLEWVGFLPHFLTQAVAALTLIKFMAVYELALAAWLLSGAWLKYSSLLSALTLAAIVVVNPSQLITTFRDIGLVCMALALFFLAEHTTAKR